MKCRLMEVGGTFPALRRRGERRQAGPGAGGAAGKGQPGCTQWGGGAGIGREGKKKKEREKKQIPNKQIVQRKH